MAITKTWAHIDDMGEATLNRVLGALGGDESTIMYGDEGEKKEAIWAQIKW